jgi:DNA-binding NarL/FixJ family response regulator
MGTNAPRNVVLVHGGFVDGSGWQGVYDSLSRDGFGVSVVQNPTLSLPGDAEATRQIIDAQDGPVVLVGHSYGGAVITEAGTHPNVAALVYIRHNAESRPPLREAADAFSVLGSARFADRAQRELRASGETVRRHRPEVWDQLTPQELQIAQLAADGLTNREIGERLYISHRTVGTHLYQLFPKLGVTSRTELRAVLEPTARHRVPD